MKILLVLLIIAITCDKEPGLRFAISNKGVESIQSIIIPQISGKELNLGNFNLTKHFDFIGTIFLNITGSKLKFDDITSDHFIMKFSNENDTTISDIGINDMSGHIEFNYTFNSGFYNNNGSGVVSLSKIGLDIKSRIYSLENKLQPGKYGPGLEIKNISLSTVNMKIEFNNTGNLEKLLAYFVDNLNDVFNNLIKSYINDKKIPDLNNQIENSLSMIKLNSTIANVTVDYSLVESPKVISDILEISFNSSISSGNSSYSGKLFPIPHVNETFKDIDLFINQYVFDSLLYVLNSENYFNNYVESEKGGLYLNTGYLGIVIPGISIKYGSDKKIDLNLTTYQAPDIILNNNFTDANIYLKTGLIVRVNETYNETAIVMDIQLMGNLSILLDQGTVKGQINELKIKKVEIISQADIGEIDIKSLQEMINNLINTSLPIINQKLFEKIGITIPDFLGISFKKTEAMSHEGYILVGMEPEKNNIKFLE